MVTPLLAPEALAATFAMSPADKRDRRLHLGLLRRFVPEWADVPFVSISTGRSTATRIWDGDGARVMADLLAGTSDAGILGILRRPAIKAATAGRSTAHRRTAEQFTMLAVASRTIDPSTVRTSWRPVWARRSRRDAAGASTADRSTPRRAAGIRAG
jgi:asparagine synthase (glutamine-hydrolysing)